LGPREVVEALPHGRLNFQIDVAHVIEKLVEFLAVEPLGALDLSFELGGAWLDVGGPIEWIETPVWTLTIAIRACGLKE